MSICVKLTMLCIEQSIIISPQIVLVEIEQFLNANKTAFERRFMKRKRTLFLSATVVLHVYYSAPCTYRRKQLCTFVNINLGTQACFFY